MSWFTWILLIGTFVGVTWVWYQVYGNNDDVVSCCGCGQCAHTGECVMVKKRTKKGGVDLTNPSERV